MKERLLLFDDEINKLKEAGWNYEIIYKDKAKKVFIVKVDVPDDIMKKANESGA